MLRIGRRGNAGMGWGDGMLERWGSDGLESNAAIANYVRGVYTDVKGN